MSEQLSAAANAMGVPEELVERSAAARATEAGTSADEILAAWAGDAPIPETTEPAEPEEAVAEPEATEEEAPPAETEPAEPVPEIVVETPAESPPPAAATPAAPYKAPVLVGARDNPMTVLVAAIGLFIVVFLVGFVGPSIQADAPGARTSAIDYSATAEEGRDVYATLGCAGCHTQMVRPVIADVGLGAVTLNDTNQILGTRRFGPDLSNVGSRITTSQLGAIVSGLGDHPSYSLSERDMEALVAYLSESQTLEEPTGSTEEESSGGESQEEEGAEESPADGVEGGES